MKNHEAVSKKGHVFLLPKKRLCLFISLMSYYIHKNKVRYKVLQEILKIREYPNLLGREYICEWPALN